MNFFRRALSETRATLALALPIAVGQVSQMLMGLTDTVMVGQVGKVPLAASALGGTIFGLFFIVGVGLLQPLSVLVARGEGAGRRDECAAYLKHAMGLAVVFSLVEALAMVVVVTQLGRLGQPPEVVEEARVYCLIIAASLPFVFIFQVLRQYSEALHRPWEPMVLMLGSVVLNVLLNWLWIYGHWGFPAGGLEGAGWATLCSRVILAGLLWMHLARTRRGDEAWTAHRWTRWESGRLREMLRLGLPASGMLLFEGGAFSAAGVMMGWIGTTALAAHQIALTCAGVTFMFMLGIATAVSIRIGQAVGAGERERLRPIGFGGLGAVVLGMSLCACVFFAFSGPIAALFVDAREREVIELGARLLVIAGCFQIFDGGQVVGSAMLRGLSDVRVPTLITFVGYWVIALPGGYVLGVAGAGGAVGVWQALAAGLAFAAVFFAVRFWKKTG
ncbi:MATE family efflux transporter [Nibricoccus sp. IMCC34717]|uniref:MATE family efflux transporter n=1 Tax=Nibricoccus sp. IMCC34717 TaxID=3034021 RepID=UPI00384F9880